MAKKHRSFHVNRGNKPNAFLAKVEAKCDQNMHLQREFTYQQCIDNMVIILHEQFGFGPVRCKRAFDAFEDTFLRNARTAIDMADGDSDMSYVKGDIDRRLKEALGEYFEPWEERFPEEIFK